MISSSRQVIRLKTGSMKMHVQNPFQTPVKPKKKEKKKSSLQNKDSFFVSTHAISFQHQKYYSRGQQLKYEIQR